MLNRAGLPDSGRQIKRATGPAVIAIQLLARCITAADGPVFSVTHRSSRQ